MNKYEKIRFIRICNNKYSTFYGLLEKDDSVSIHKPNLRLLAREMKS